MNHLFDQFWHCIVISGFLFGLMVIGGIGALMMKILNISLESSVIENIHSKAALDRLDLWLFRFSKSCISFYVMSAQWIGSVALFLLVLGGLGRFVMFTMMHWREIWGP